MDSYEPMSLARLAQHLTATVEERVRWKLVWEFLEEYRWESSETQIGLLQTAPQHVGDERWDALLACEAVASGQVPAHRPRRDRRRRPANVVLGSRSPSLGPGHRTVTWTRARSAY